MSDITKVGEDLLAAWLNLSSTLWNTRIVTSMTYNEAHVLGILMRHNEDSEPMTATDLIRRTRLLKSQMNKILTTLEKQDYISRERADTDKRLIYIRLTENGKAAYLHEHKNVEGILDALVNRLGVERAAHLTKEISALTDVLDTIVPMPK